MPESGVGAEASGPAMVVTWAILPVRGAGGNALGRRTWLPMPARRSRRAPAGPGRVGPRPDGREVERRHFERSGRIVGTAHGEDEVARDDATSAAAVWGSFEHDPRDRANAVLRASDTDREVIARVLTAAYADGRLDREEFDQRAETASAARTLGELPPIVADLVPERVPARRPTDELAVASPAELDRKAEEAWQDRRRNAFFGFLGPTLICWAIYLAVNGGRIDGFVWPLIVMAATGLNLIRTLASHQEIQREELRRLEKQQAKALRKRGWRG